MLLLLLLLLLQVILDTDDEEDSKSSGSEDDGDVKEIGESEEEQSEEDAESGLLNRGVSQSDSDDDIPLVSRNRLILDSDGEESGEDVVAKVGLSVVCRLTNHSSVQVTSLRPSVPLISKRGRHDDSMDSPMVGWGDILPLSPWTW